MHRRARILAAIILPALMLTAVPTVAGASVIEDYARVIRSRHAGANFLWTDGCVQTEVMVTAMDAKFGSLHGTINKQGLVGVFYAQRDVCAEPGPKGYPILYAADGNSLDRLRTAPRFGSAWTQATLHGSDSDGNPVEIGLNIEWSALQPFEKSRVMGNAWFPSGVKRGAHLHTFSFGLRAPATARGEVSINGETISLSPTFDATLEQVRYFCQVIQHPQGGYDTDC
jgi:hypothetical protein